MRSRQSLCNSSVKLHCFYLSFSSICDPKNKTMMENHLICRKMAVPYFIFASKKMYEFSILSVQMPTIVECVECNCSLQIIKTYLIASNRKRTNVETQERMSKSFVMLKERPSWSLKNYLALFSNNWVTWLGKKKKKVITYISLKLQRFGVFHHLENIQEKSCREIQKSGKSQS